MWCWLYPFCSSQLLRFFLGLGPSDAVSLSYMDPRVVLGVIRKIQTQWKGKKNPEDSMDIRVGVEELGRKTAELTPSSPSGKYLNH